MSKQRVRVSAESDRETADLQRDALLAANIDARHLFEDHASGAKYDRLGLVTALAYVRPSDDTATPANGQKPPFKHMKRLSAFEVLSH